MHRVRVRQADVFLRPVRTRMPFRYGKAVVTEEPIAHLRIVAEIDGHRALGVSAAALPPLWFDKDPSKTHADNIADLLRSLRAAADVYTAAPAAPAFALHQTCEAETRRRLRGLNDLTAGFGVALLDAAAIDALCRATGTTFHGALRDDLLGFGPLELPERPLDRVQVRHTVGMADPITAADVREPVGDGLPETLEDVARVYGVRYYKVKVSGDVEDSLDRLRRIAAVLRGDYQVTLDGNEQFHAMEEAAAFVRRVSADPALREFWGKTLWIEQPVERSRALEDDVHEALEEIDRLKPVIIDESDGTDAAVDRALTLGYRGISAKNCKGVFRTLHSHRRTREACAVLSSEDLMNIPVVPLHQDLAVAAALGIGHSERNGHHYIRAFEYFSPREKESTLREYPSLYRVLPSGLGAVKIENGAMSVVEINAAPFGVLTEPDWDVLIK
ncbi:MAG TPA: enolase C-terminal domain-like protein [Planctomycetota bacterium]